MEYSIEDLAYAAGLTDGEGCISIARVLPTKGNRRVTPGYELYITLSSTNQPVIEWLKITFGGNITDRSKHPSKINIKWKPSWVWRLTSNEARSFLVLILPYLKIKQAQALIGIEFQAYKKSHSLKFKDYQREQEILEQEETYYQQLNSMHATRKQWTGNEDFIRTTNYPVPTTLTTTDFSYIAGIFDGEGCIRVSVRMPNEKTGKGHLRQPSYCLRAKLTNTDRAIIEWFQTMYPGYIQECSSEENRAKTGFSQAWEWGINSNAAHQFLKLIMPFLKIKQQQAILAIEFHCYYMHHARYIQGTRPQEVLDCQEAYRQQINGMNAKHAKDDAA